MQNQFPALRRKAVAPAVALAFAAATITASAAQATVLTFDIDNTKPNASLSMSQAYGDRVAAQIQSNATYGVGAEGFTPNVLVSYGVPTAGSLIRWTTDYGDLTNILENEVDGSTYMDVLFTADPGYMVTLFGFDLAGWLRADYTLPAGVRVSSGADTLFSQANVLVQGNGVGPKHTSFDFGAGLTGQTLALRIDLTGMGNNSDNIGLDNIRFGQVSPVPTAVPEPSAWALMILGLAGAGGAMRRQRRRALAG